MEKANTHGTAETTGVVIARVSIHLQVDAKAPRHRGAPKLHPVLPSGSDLGRLDLIRRHTRLAEKHRPEPTKIAQAHAGEEIRTAADAAAPPIDLEAPPRELAVDVRPMRVASSRELDEIDLQGTQTLMQANSGVASRWAESFAAVGNLADTTGVSEFASVAVAQQLRGGKPTGAPWMLQMLATLGGAASAGSIAWFLISPKRERRFG